MKENNNPKEQVVTEIVSHGEESNALQKETLKKGYQNETLSVPEDFCLKDKIKKEEFEIAIFEMLQILDEKSTKLINRFDKLAKELGYKV